MNAVFQPCGRGRLSGRNRTGIDTARRRREAQPVASIDTVIFDLGGVLMLNGGPADFTKRYPEHDPKVLQAILMGPYAQDTDHHWHRVERGELSMAEAREANRVALAAAGITLTPGRPGAMVFERNDAMIALVGELRTQGLRTGMLTNNVKEFRELWWPLADWPSMFDDIVDSHELGMRKPNPAIYRLALERLGAVAGNAAFLDDIESNVHAASAVGMTGIHVTGDGADAIATVRDLTGLQPPASRSN